MSKLPTARPTLPRDHELLVLNRIVDLYAVLEPEARKRVHLYLTQRLDSLPTIAEVQPADDEQTEAPVLPFPSRNRDGADEQTAS